MNALTWVQHTFQTISALLDNINRKAITVVTQDLQKMLGSVDMRTVENVCGKIHQADFNGRECKVLLSTTGWVPLVGYISYVWQSEWVVNHVGYLVRAGTHMLLFDPNYGLGLFQITDDQPLTLKNLTDAVRGLAWAHSVSAYYLSTTAAIAVIDEDSLRLRVSHSLEEKVRSLSEMAQRFRRDHL
jgi:hypothetical protein